MIRHGSPPFAITALEHSIQAQIPLTGHAFAEDTDLTKFGTRYYNPTLGRWTQQDPVGGSLGDLNSANRYVYAGDDPVNLVDSSGELTCAAAWVLFILTEIGTGVTVIAAAASLGVLIGAALLGIAALFYAADQVTLACYGQNLI